MRTTITLDDDVARRLRRNAAQSNKSFKELINETLRRGLAAGVRPHPSPDRFTVKAKARGFRPGIDPLKLNQLADELEIAEFAGSSHSGPRAK